MKLVSQWVGDLAQAESKPFVGSLSVVQLSAEWIRTENLDESLGFEMELWRFALRNSCPIWRLLPYQAPNGSTPAEIRNHMRWLGAASVLQSSLDCPLFHTRCIVSHDYLADELVATVDGSSVPAWRVTLATQSTTRLDPSSFHSPVLLDPSLELQGVVT